MEWLTEEDQKAKDSAIFPKFYTRQTQHKAKSLEAGRPIFVESEFIEIRIGGDNKNIIDRKVTEKDKKRWPKHYEAYKAGKEGLVEGTPLKEWGSLPSTRALELNAVNVFTVEQLAEIPDSGLSYLGMDGRDLRTRAQAFIKLQNEAGFSEKMALENQRLSDDVEFLKQKITPLLDKLDRLTKEVEKLRGDSDE